MWLLAATDCGSRSPREAGDLELASGLVQDQAAGGASMLEELTHSLLGQSIDLELARQHLGEGAHGKQDPHRCGQSIDEAVEREGTLTDLVLGVDNDGHGSGVQTDRSPLIVMAPRLCATWRMRCGQELQASADHAMREM